MKLVDQTPDSFESVDREATVVTIPIAGVRSFGAHLTLGAGLRLVDAVVARADEELGPQILVTPVLPHSAAPGELFHHLVTEGFRRFFFVLDSQPFGGIAVAALAKIKLANPNLSLAVASVSQLAGAGDMDESLVLTSILLFIAPDEVDGRLLRADALSAVPPMPFLISLPDELSADGFPGDPTGSSIEAGRELFEGACQTLTEQIRSQAGPYVFTESKK